jgi:hypothetical protein
MKSAMKKMLSMLLLFFGVLLGNACSKDDAYENKYADHAKTLASRVAINRDNEALNQLLAETKSSDFWTKSYAVDYLAGLLKDKNVMGKDKIIDALVVVLDDARQGLPRDAIDGLANAGQDGVVKGFSKMRVFVLSGHDDGVNWRAAEALGVITDPPTVNDAIQVLAQALQYKTENESVKDAPQLRDEALRSLEQISEKQPILVHDALEKILPKLDKKYTEKVSALMHSLQNKNESTSQP